MKDNVDTLQTMVTEQFNKINAVLTKRKFELLEMLDEYLRVESIFLIIIIYIIYIILDKYHEGKLKTTLQTVKVLETPLKN